jgi:hypothetical protein
MRRRTIKQGLPEHRSEIMEQDQNLEITPSECYGLVLSAATAASGLSAALVLVWPSPGMVIAASGWNLSRSFLGELASSPVYIYLQTGLTSIP